jgi:hypothetical protein
MAQLEMGGLNMRRVLSLALVSFAVLAAGAAAKADLVVNVTGQFGDDLLGATGLAGGSFTATFAVPDPPGLPAPAYGFAYFDSYSVSLYDSHGTLVSSFGTVPGGGGVADVYSILDVAVFQSASGAVLDLDFAAPFNGTGAVIPFNSALGPYASFYGDGNSNAVEVASGQAAPAAAVPEPSSLAIVAVTGLLVAARWSIARRRKGEGQSPT